MISFSVKRLNFNHSIDSLCVLIIQQQQYDTIEDHRLKTEKIDENIKHFGLVLKVD